MRRAAAVLVSMVLVACSTSVRPTTGSTPLEGPGVQVDTPPGWHRIEGMPNGAIALTKNGVDIDAITVSRASLDERLPNTRKRFQAEMSPEEAAEVDISNRQFAPGIDGFELLDRGTAVIDGRACYHYTYSYRQGFGRLRKVKDYGCVVAPVVYRFHFSAPSEQTFPELLPAFEALVASARISPAATPG